MPKKLKFNNAEYNLVAYLFRQFVEEHNLDTKQLEYVTIKELYTWVNDKGLDIEILFPDHEEMLKEYDLKIEDFDNVIKLFECPFATCAQLYCLWPLVTLSCRPIAKYKMTKAKLTAEIFFEDGVLLAFPMDLVPPDGSIDVATIIALWRSHITILCKDLINLNLEELHDLNADVVKDGLSATVTKIDK